MTLQCLLSKFQSDFPGKLRISWDLHSTVAGKAGGPVYQLLPGGILAGAGIESNLGNDVILNSSAFIQKTTKANQRTREQQLLWTKRGGHPHPHTKFWLTSTAEGAGDTRSLLRRTLTSTPASFLF